MLVIPVQLDKIGTQHKYSARFECLHLSVNTGFDIKVPKYYLMIRYLVLGKLMLLKVFEKVSILYCLFCLCLDFDVFGMYCIGFILNNFTWNQYQDGP